MGSSVDPGLPKIVVIPKERNKLSTALRTVGSDDAPVVT